MQKGLDHVERLRGSGNIDVFFFEGNKQRTSRQKITDVILKTKGSMKIVDKFYSRETLNMLEKFDHGVEIQMLTARLSNNENEAKFDRDLVHFKQEFKNVEIRKYPKEYELHDRYVITEDSLVLLGHGLLDIGSKESFTIVLKKENAKEIMSSLGAKFDDRWRVSSKL